MSAPTFFISYRRDDSQAWAGRIADYLNEQTNTKVLIDVDSISRGQDYTAAIAESVRAADVVLVVIGQSWLNATDADGEVRLNDQDDPVRLEVLWSLEQEKLIVPVLVDGAPMPTRKNLPEELGDLAVRNGLTLNHQTFRRDLEQLIRDFSHLGAAIVDPDSLATSTAAPTPPAPATVATQVATPPAMSTAEAAGGLHKPEPAAPASTTPPPTPPQPPLVPPTPPVGPVGDYLADLADPWKRIGAAMIDVVLVFCTLFIGWIVWSIILFSRGQTPGLQLMKMRVVDLSTGRQASSGKMFVREFVIAFGIGILLLPLTAGVSLLVSIGMTVPMFFNDKRQEVRDMMVGTTVVDDPSGRYTT